MLPVDTAVTLIVNVAPLMDDTDFITRETGIAYDEAGMDLVWTFQAVDGTITQTAVTPTTGGDYDWTHVGDGIYKIEMPASGGASANNDAKGYGYFSGICDGVLAWVGPTYSFVPTAVVNSLVGGTDTLPVDAPTVEQIQSGLIVKGETLRYTQVAKDDGNLSSDTKVEDIP
jgi:hypothetical protein